MHLLLKTIGDAKFGIDCSDGQREGESESPYLVNISFFSPFVILAGCCPWHVVEMIRKHAKYMTLCGSQESNK